MSLSSAHQSFKLVTGFLRGFSDLSQNEDLKNH